MEERFTRASSESPLSPTSDQFTPILIDTASRYMCSGFADVSLPNLGSGQVHAIDTDEIAEMWFVVFDGAGNGTQKSALLARECDPDTFYGA